jgi:hypothetical protein
MRMWDWLIDVVDAYTQRPIIKQEKKSTLVFWNQIQGDKIS